MIEWQTTIIWQCIWSTPWTESSILFVLNAQNTNEHQVCHALLACVIVKQTITCSFLAILPLNVLCLHREGISLHHCGCTQHSKCLFSSINHYFLWNQWPFKFIMLLHRLFNKLPLVPCSVRSYAQICYKCTQDFIKLLLHAGWQSY